MKSQQRPGQPFWDPQAPQASFSSSLPDPLRIKASGPQTHQLRVYEEFGALSVRSRSHTLT